MCHYHPKKLLGPPTVGATVALLIARGHLNAGWGSKWMSLNMGWSMRKVGHVFFEYGTKLIWLVVSTPLKNMSSSVGMMTIPNIWKNETCSKPPTSDIWYPSPGWSHGVWLRKWRLSKGLPVQLQPLAAGIDSRGSIRIATNKDSHDVAVNPPVKPGRCSLPILDTLQINNCNLGWPVSLICHSFVCSPNNRLSTCMGLIF